MEAKSISYKEKGKDKKLPEGAKIIEKNLRIDVEEIENGFLVSKEYSIEYKLRDNIQHMWFTKKIYSKDNPLEGVDLDIDVEEESLADKF